MYKKIYFKYNNEKVMTYTMVKKSIFMYPSERYLNIIKQGYKDCNLDNQYLKKAFKKLNIIFLGFYNCISILIFK